MHARIHEEPDDSSAATTSAWVADPALQPGAHLVSPRWGYVHHGIYAGQGRVIHYRGLHRSLRRGPVEEVSLEEFAHGRPVRVRAWVAPRFSGIAAVERARSRLGEDRYRFWSNNCEHFCEWCLSGTSRSLQVQAWQERVARLLGWGLRWRGAGTARITPET